MRRIRSGGWLVALALSAAPLAAQPVLAPVREGTGAVTPAVFARDGFTYAFGTRLRGLTGKPTGAAFVGAIAPCRFDAPCADVRSGIDRFAVAGFGVAVNDPFNEPEGPGPLLFANLTDDNEGSWSNYMWMSRALTRPINAFYVAPSGWTGVGTYRVTGSRLLAAEGDSGAEFTLAYDPIVGPEPQFAYFRPPLTLADPRRAPGPWFELTFAFEPAGLVESATDRPSFDLYFGYVTTVPEPGTATLSGAALVALFALATVRRRAHASGR